MDAKSMSSGQPDFTFAPSAIRLALQQAFAKVAVEYGTENLSVKTLFKADGNPKSKADFSLYLSPCVYPVLCGKLNSVCDFLKRELSDVFEECRVTGDGRLHFFLNRPRTYRSVFKNVFCSQNEPETKRKSVLLNVCCKESQDLTSYRSVVMAEHIAAILTANGFIVYCDRELADDLCGFKYPDRVRWYGCVDCDMGSVYAEWAVLCENSNYKISSDEINSAQTCEEILLDPVKYFKLKTDHHRPYHENIKQVCIKKTDFTDCFRRSAKLHHILREHATDVGTIFHIVPLQQQVSVQKAGLIVEMIGNSDVEQMYLTNQIVVAKDDPSLTITEYKNNIRRGIESSLKHKYGSEVLNDELWLTRLDILTQTVVKFDFLMTSFSSQLNIDSYSSESGFQDKGGTFVQYNCARLAVIFKRHHDGVKNGVYEELPDIDKVDFSLLKLQDEWNLFCKYVLPYPDMLSELQHSIDNRDSVEVCVATHRVSRMLVNLSRDLSLYYNKSRVLVEPCARLFPKMNARLYLLKAVYYVMESGLSLLNLSPVEQM